MPSLRDSRAHAGSLLGAEEVEDEMRKNFPVTANQTAPLAA